MALRLYVPDDLAAGPLRLPRDQSHYLTNVMRVRMGDPIHLFNGRDGEWAGQITVLHKNGVQLDLAACVRPQQSGPELRLLAAPIKKDCLDWLVEKAVELGVSHLCPVITARTQVSRVNEDRLRAQMAEAAEQCERLTVPTLFPAQDVLAVVKDWPEQHPLLFLEERSPDAPPLLAGLADVPADGPLGVLVGPEGGFTPDEKSRIRRFPAVRPVSLGPRILRAETAALTALALIQGWRDQQTLVFPTGEGA